jgi:hypothetical protein
MRPLLIEVRQRVEIVRRAEIDIPTAASERILPTGGFYQGGVFCRLVAG